MKRTKIGIVPELPKGTKLELVEGKVVQVGDQKSGGDGDKAWKMQLVDIEDDTGKIGVQIWGHDPVSKASKGRMIRLVAGSDDGKACGILTDEYKDKPRIKVTEAGNIEWGGGGQEQQERPATRQQQAASEPRDEPPHEQRQQRQAPSNPQEAQNNAKFILGKVVHAYTLCYDAAAATAHAIFARHKQIVPGGAIGIMADKFMIELGRRGAIDMLSPIDPAKIPLKTKPVGELCSLLGDAAVDAEVRKVAAVRAATAPPQAEQPAPAANGQPGEDRGWPTEEELRRQNAQRNAHRHEEEPLPASINHDDIPF